MRTTGIVSSMLFLVNLVAVSVNFTAPQSDTSSTDYRDITNNFSIQEFEDITNFILKNGDRQTYCGIYGNNPHYSFDGFDAYLNPEIGQRNVGCDPEISGFNEITLRDLSDKQRYYHIRIARKGDSENEWIYIPKGMTEEKVYIYRYNNSDNLDAMANSVLSYLTIIKKEMSSGVLFIPGMQRRVIDIQPAKAGEVRIGIFNLQGRLLVRQRILNHDGVLYHADVSISKLPQGFYTGRLLNNNQSTTITFFKK